MSEILNSTENAPSVSQLHNDVKKQLEKIPSFLEMLLVMPENPAAITDKINRYRSIKAKRDADIMQSIHDYYSAVK